MTTSFLDSLEARGALQDVSHREELEKMLAGEPISFYCGFDPTAESLHVGNLLPMMFMRRIARLGHQAIGLIGTGTGMIGDPSGKSSERVLLNNEAVLQNAAGIEAQVKSILSKGQSKAPLVVKNHTWIGELSLIDFLRDTGKHFSVNAMVAKDSVKARLENREQGISYTEFSYMLLQAYDFLWLSKNHNCRLQVGGSDQWGNITAG
ncbi:UNVERIFIED_CONTAM: hypothetical protein GTU68_013536, partial [Idotea baltica]|nr:hypothetical protein [Idotea baltica]